MSATRPAWLETLTMEPPWPSRMRLRAAYLVTSSAPRAFDRHHLVKHRDVGLLRGGDLAAVAGAVHHAPQVDAVDRLADGVFRGEIEGERPGAGLFGDRAERVEGASRGDDVGAARRQLADGRPADATGRAGHQNGAALEFVHQSVFLAVGN
nr:hypothetical protein [Nakamurella aerolata]